MRQRQGSVVLDKRIETWKTDAAAGSPLEGRIRPMYLRWGAAQESLQ